MASLILASSSPYRRELLARLGLPFEVVRPGVDEAAESDPDPGRLAEHLALLKARAVARQHPRAVVIGSDQVAECNGRRLGKPGTVDRAIEQLTFTAGRDVIFHTAVAVIRAGHEQVRTVPTTVQLRPLDEARIRAYVERDRPLDCAGAMKSESLGIVLAERMASDDPTALIGLPLITLSILLEQAGLQILGDRIE